MLSRPSRPRTKVLRHARSRMHRSRTETCSRSRDGLPSTREGTPRRGGAQAQARSSKPPSRARHMGVLGRRCMARAFRHRRAEHQSWSRSLLARGRCHCADALTPIRTPPQDAVSGQNIISSYSMESLEFSIKGRPTGCTEREIRDSRHAEDAWVSGWQLVPW